MQAKKFEYECIVLEQYLDVFGHVNNAAYLVLFEQARWDILTKNGYGLETIGQEKKGPVVLDVSLRFKKELKNRERMTIVSCVIDNNQKIMKMKQEIFKADGELACDAIFTFGFMDLKLRKLIEPTSKWLEAVGIS